jgi:hypothetical protein
MPPMNSKPFLPLGNVALSEVRRWANTCDDVGGRVYALPLVDAYEELVAEFCRLRTSMEQSTWLLDGAADSIDEWFPSDPDPETQNDLRRFAQLWRATFGLHSFAEHYPNGDRDAER